MTVLTRRSVLRLAGSTLVLPRVALAQSDNRPVVTIAVQALVTSNTLDPVAEQSNVGSRILNNYVELLIGRNLQSQLEPFPQLATEWKRVDEKTLDVTLRQGVRFHNGDEMTAEDVAFTFSAAHMFGTTGPNGGTIPMDMARPVQR